MWIPGHIGIIGNEFADSAADEATRLDSDVGTVPASDIKSLVRKYCNKLFQEFWDNSGHKLANIKCHKFKCRRDETHYHRVRLGHTRITHSFLFEGGYPIHPICEHCQATLTVKHFLLECPNITDKRELHIGNIQTLEDFFSN